MSELDHFRDEVQRLLSELCIKLGFCLPFEEQQQLSVSPPADVERFTDAVFEAEGLDAHQHKHLRRTVRDMIDQHNATLAPDEPD